MSMAPTTCGGPESGRGRTLRPCGGAGAVRGLGAGAGCESPRRVSLEQQYERRDSQVKS